MPSGLSWSRTAQCENRDSQVVHKVNPVAWVTEGGTAMRASWFQEWTGIDAASHDGATRWACWSVCPPMGPLTLRRAFAGGAFSSHGIALDAHWNFFWRGSSQGRTAHHVLRELLYPARSGARMRNRWQSPRSPLQSTHSWVDRGGQPGFCKSAATAKRRVETHPLERFAS